MVIGGMAMIQKGFVRATEDIDLFVDGSPDNVTKIKRALAFLPDNAVKDVGVNDLIDYVVVRVADEIVIDLMRSACGVEYSEVKDEIEKVTIKDVEIPFARARLLLRLKQTLRSKDEMDRQFLQNLMEEEKA
jgi:copper chaperone CopZ